MIEPAKKYIILYHRTAVVEVPISDDDITEEDISDHDNNTSDEDEQDDERYWEDIDISF